MNPNPNPNRNLNRRKMAIKPMRINLDEQRASDVKRNRETQNRRRDRLRPVGHREDLSEYEDSAVILSLDPGGTTGWSIMEIAPEAISDLPEHRGIGVVQNILRWKHGQVDCGSRRGDLGTNSAGLRNGGVSSSGENAGVGEILGLIRNWPTAVVVIEDFILDFKRFSSGRDLLSPVRITSSVVFDLWLQRRDHHLQTPSLAKSTARDEQLKAWGLYTSTGGLGHARDADRHSITFAKRASEVTSKGRALRMAAWPHLYGKVNGVEGPFYNPGRKKVSPSELSPSPSEQSE